MKKILLIFHSNICNKNSGINSRLCGIATILYDMGYMIDIFVPQAFDQNWDTSSCKFVDKCFVPNANETEKKKREEYTLFEKFFRCHKNSRKNIKKIDWITENEIIRFKDVINNNEYEAVIFSYVYYIKLLDFIPQNILKIGDISDFVSLQEFQAERYKFGEIIDEEINAITKLDRALFISSDEMAFFSNFGNSENFYYLPHSAKVNTYPLKKKDIDILFIGSDNPHNIKGIDWFLKKVYPNIMNKGHNITIVGKITQKIDKKEYSDINFLDFVENLEEVYNKTKLVISPLKSGTGIKIKIVEAMSHGIPIVCTPQSLVGFMEKQNNGCIVANDVDEFTKAISDVLENDELSKKLSSQGLEQKKKYFSDTYMKNTLKNVLNKS